LSFIEVRLPGTPVGVMTVWEYTNSQGPGLQLATNKGMRTSGFLLPNFKNVIRTEGLNSDLLATRFERAATPFEFLAKLATRPGAPDRIARPSEAGRCGASPCPINGQPVRVQPLSPTGYAPGFASDPRLAPPGMVYGREW
jgi:hypothetical protein